MAKLQELTDASFAEEVEREGGVVAVDFWAPWCGPCRITKPILQSLADEYGERVRIRALDTDLNPDAAVRYGVRSLPTVVFFRDGAEVGRVVGAVPALVFRRHFEEAIGAAAEL